jgi:hypothetical protein
MANPTQVQIDKFTTNTTRLDSFVNGGINDTVTLDSGTIKSLTGVIGELSAVNPRGNWTTATTYAQKDIVVESSVVYICVIAHTSGTFSTDLSSGYWGAYQIDPTNAVTLLNDLTVTGDLVVNGTTTQVDSTVTMLSDPIITLSKDTQTVNDGKDRGIEFKYYDTSEKLGFFGWDRSVNAFTFVPDATNGSEVISGSVGNAIFNTVTANLSGDVTGDVTGNLTGTILTASQTNITGVGALSTGSITNTFGNIDIGSSNLTATGTTTLESVGIGTASPSSKLQIESAYTLANGTSQFLLKNTTDGESACIAFEAVSSGGSTGNKGAIYFNAGAGGAVTDNRLELNANHQNSITPHLSINGNGNVGIGDTSPVTRFDVTSANSSISAKFGRYDNHGLFLHSDGGSGTYNWRVTTQTVVDGGLEIAPSTSTGGTTWASPVLVVKQSQRVGVNLNSPSYALDVSGSIAYSGSLVSTSDKTLKKNIQKCPDDIFSKLLQIESKKFNYKNEKDTKDYFGFIAQDVEKIFPSLVQKRSDGTLTLSYVEMIPLLLKAIQELHKSINPTGKINLG